MSDDQWGSGQGFGGPARSERDDDSWGAGFSETNTLGAQPGPTPPKEGAAVSLGPRQPETKGRKKTLILLAVIAVVVLVAAGIAYAMNRNGEEPSDVEAASSDVATSTESSPSESASPTSSTQSSSSSAAPTSASTTASGSCSVEALPADTRPQHGRIVVSKCDGQWMVAGIRATDAVWLSRWNGREWETIKTTGRGVAGDCYDNRRLDQINVPSSFKDEVYVCNREVSTESPENSHNSNAASMPRPKTPACDGRNILIVDSVIVHPGEDADALVRDSLRRNPNASYMKPGHCPSLRAQAEGGEVYPIYVDYGSDRSRMCSMAARSGGNPRTLNTQGDFSSPCG